MTLGPGRTGGEIISRSQAETVAFGKEFSRKLMRGDVVAMYGDLGSGKTHFVKGVCEGVGIHANVTSPTFTILNEYFDGSLPIFHFDCYRLRSSADLDEIGFDEYIYDNGVCLVEWADVIQEKLPARRYNISLRLGSTRDVRIIRIERSE